MKAGPVTIRHLFENRQRFCVPIYQRHYVWSRSKQWEPFWNDIRTKTIELLEGRERRFSHFLGAVVLEARSDTSAKQVHSFQVVDGQQRLTTFQIFLAAARDYASIKGFEQTKHRIESFIFNGNQHLMVEPEVEKFKVWPTQYDREMLKDVLISGRKELQKKYREYFYKTRDKVYPYRTTPKILGAYDFFFEKIKHAAETEDLEDEIQEEIATNLDTNIDVDLKQAERRLDAILEALIKEFKVVEIILHEGDDAQVIFETLNDRSEELLAMDLVRNNIFQRADSQGEDAENLFASHWNIFEDTFWEHQEKQGRYKKPRSELFLGNFIAGRIGSEVALSKLFSEYKAFTKSFYEAPSPLYSKVEQELVDLARFGSVYRRLLEPSDDDILGRFAQNLHVWDVTTVFPLVLRLTTEEIDDTELEECLRTLLSYVVRRAVCGFTTKNYNKFFLSVVRELQKNGWDKRTLDGFLLEQNSNTNKFPDDREFERAWLNDRMYLRLSSGKLRFLLEAIEISKRGKFQEIDRLSSELTVEHILPDQWRTFWPLSDGSHPDDHEFYLALASLLENDARSELIVNREAAKHTIGNLTLLTRPFNSKISNAAWDDKRRELREHSLLIMNREIAEREHWNEDEIRKRSQEMFLVAREMWSYPLL